MKVAIVHDSISEFGGAERVLQILIEIFENAVVYTSFADNSIINNFFPTIKDKVRIAWTKYTNLHKHNSLFQVVSPLVWNGFNFAEYDLIISSSAYLLCNLIPISDNQIHIQYLHSPPKNLFGLDQMSRLQRIFPYTSIISNLYIKALKSSRYIITNSYHMHNVFNDIFGIKSKVIYPPVNVPNHNPSKKRSEYFLCVSRLDRTKKLELVIRACNELLLPLIIVGESTEEKYESYLRNISGKTIRFLGFQSDIEVDRLYQNATAFVFPSIAEDFGIAPVEAMAHGVPVIAYYGGGVKETVINGVTGKFFYKHSADALIDLLKTFDSKKFSNKIIYQHALKFSKGVFKQNFLQYIKNISGSINY